MFRICTPTSLLVLLMFISCASARQEIKINAEQGVFEYDSRLSVTHGAYSEPGCSCRLKTSFKQGNRDTANPQIVAKGIVTKASSRSGRESIALQIGYNNEANTRSTATYKVALNLIDGTLVKPPIVKSGQAINLHYSMRIDRETFSFDQTNPIIFSQFWQGSPLAPPLSMHIRGDHMLDDSGSETASIYLAISDDYNGASAHLPGKPNIFLLAPVIFNEWMEWSVVVRPDPKKEGAGEIKITLDGSNIFYRKGIQVGYSVSNPIFGRHVPLPAFSAIELMLYRRQGMGLQIMYFDDIGLTIE